MGGKKLPRYPVYIISKGRWDNPLTANFLIRDGVSFHIVVEPQEADFYAYVLGRERLLVTPFSNLGLGSIPVRNWVWEHAKASGAERHWILDDNIRYVERRWQGKRLQVNAGIAFAAIEDFTDRYENVAMAGPNYHMFVAVGAKTPPFHLNHRVYSCLLIRNDLPHRWRGRYNEDADLCLQVLADGWCTVLVNAFLIEKVTTLTMKGGNATELYKGDGRLKMARSLERMWPGVVTTDRRFQRPQHVVKDSWRKFDTPLRLKPGIDLEALKAAGPNEYGMELVQVKPIKSETLRALVKDKLCRPNPSTA